MIATALEAERRAYLEAHAEVTDSTGRRLVGGNGYPPDTARARRRAKFRA